MATARRAELRALAQRVADTFPFEVIEVVLTGSVWRGVAGEASDIELLAIIKPLSLEQAFEPAGLVGVPILVHFGRHTAHWSDRG